MNQTIHIIGYGNPGRQDDGLGPALIAKLQSQMDEALLQQLKWKDDYQLNVEDALDIQSAQYVIFADASINCHEPFEFEKVSKTSNPGLGSHSLSPEQLMQLCETLYGSRPQAYTLAIRGYKFDRFEEQLSPHAQENLNEALSFLTQWISEQIDCEDCAYA